MSKKFFLILGAVVVAVLLAGCSDSNNTKNNEIYTTVKGEVVSVETGTDLLERGIEIEFDGPLFITIKEKNGTLHKVYLWQFIDLDGKMPVQGTVMKVRYRNHWTIDGGEKIYDEDGLYLSTEAVEKWHDVEAFVVLSTPPVVVEAEPRTKVRDMEVGTYGYVPAFYLKSVNQHACINNRATVYESPTAEGIIDVFGVVKVERQDLFAFRVSPVDVPELDLYYETSSIVLQLCS